MPINPKTTAIILAVLMATGLLPASDPGAEMYRFLDEDGILHYADSLPAEGASEVETLAEAIKPDNCFEGLAQALSATFSPKTGVERASLATLTVNSPFGRGSGFFITGRGHILTSRHVLEGNLEHMAQVESRFERVAEQMDRRALWLSQEEERLEKTRTNLEQTREAADAISDKKKRRQALVLYEGQMTRYQSWKKNVDRQREEHEKQKKEFRHERYLFKNRLAVAGITRHFTVVAKDGRELSAWLVRCSRDHDLALLKVDGYNTPWLEPADMTGLGQGSAVFSIGSPATLRDSVSCGVISGFEGGFVKTDADIYPGNSGGPLVTPNGKVVGINTFKLLTDKFEGLGFAIPVRTALEEFAAELGRPPGK